VGILFILTQDGLAFSLAQSCRVRRHASSRACRFPRPVASIYAAAFSSDGPLCPVAHVPAVPLAATREAFVAQASSRLFCLRFCRHPACPELRRERSRGICGSPWRGHPARVPLSRLPIPQSPAGTRF